MCKEEWIEAQNFGNQEQTNKTHRSWSPAGEKKSEDNSGSRLAICQEMGREDRGKVCRQPSGRGCSELVEGSSFLVHIDLDNGKEINAVVEDGVREALGSKVGDVGQAMKDVIDKGKRVVGLRLDQAMFESPSAVKVIRHVNPPLEPPY